MRGRGLAKREFRPAAVPLLAALALSAPGAHASGKLAERAKEYLADLVRLDTTNPPGNETAAAEYLKSVAGRWGIPSELLGADPSRLNFVARLPGSGKARPLLLMAHTDVVPADSAQWTAEPFGAEIRDGYLYGRGAVDDKSLLAAHLAVLVELKARRVPLRRDVILLAEADEEAGSTGIRWLIENAWHKIDAQAALNEGGFTQETRSGFRLFHVQTAEKIPTRIVLTARGTAGHGSLPRPDNPIVRLSRAIVRLADADQPVRLNAATRRYLSELAKLPDFQWLAPLIPRLDNPYSAVTAANAIRVRHPELNSLLRTTVSPTVLSAGLRVNVIPNAAVAQLDIRRLPDETREEILVRFRRFVNDSAVEVSAAPGEEMPATEPSSLATPVYQAIERVLAAAVPKAVVLPYMARGATDGSFLRRKGVAVYGVPVFLKEIGENRAHGNDERISLVNLASGTELLWKIVLNAAAEDVL
jgi:acetylornithine deacetylase/succinyl-diaminopimelate desuccinylase-like protein